SSTSAPAPVSPVSPAIAIEPLTTIAAVAPLESVAAALSARGGLSTGGHLAGAVGRRLAFVGQRVAAAGRTLVLVSTAETLRRWPLVVSGFGAFPRWRWFL